MSKGLFLQLAAQQDDRPLRKNPRRFEQPVLAFLILLGTAFASRDAGAATLKDFEDLKIYNLEKEYRKLATLAFSPRNADALELKLVVESMMSIYGSVYVNEVDNTLFVTDTPEMVEEIGPIVRRLDVAGLKAGGNLTSRLVRLRHSSVADVAAILPHKLSPSGTLFVVEQQNAVLITDVPSKASEVEAALREVDVPVKHVLIESAIVEINSERYHAIGLDLVSWMEGVGLTVNARHHDQDGTDSRYTYYSRIPQDSWSSVIDTSARGTAQMTEIVDVLSRKTGGRVLANPRLVARNNATASLSAMDRIPTFPARDQGQPDGRESTEGAGVSLRVRSTIHDDGHVDLHVSPKINSLNGWTPAGHPIVFERSLTTDARIRSGDTFVLGGMKRTEVANTTQGIPLLKDIPGLRYLFSRTISVKIERDVLIFLSPHVLEEDDASTAPDKEQLKRIRGELRR